MNEENNNKDTNSRSVKIKSSNYILLDKIGKGAHGVVYKVKSKVDNLFYAMKIVNLDSFKESTKEKLKREGKILEKLSHENVVRVFESFIENGKLYLIMEFADKKDLYDVVKQHKLRKKKIPEHMIWKYIQGILEGLRYLRKNSILHRDIKPSNIFVNCDNVPKIGDFGVSVLMDEELHPYLQGKTCGTPLFYAPEMFLKKKYSYKIDIWALGCVCYYICNQQVPFKGKDLRKLGYLIVNKTPKEIDSFYSSRLRGYIMLMLEKKKKIRPNVQELITIMEKGLSISNWIERRTGYVDLMEKREQSKDPGFKPLIKEIQPKEKTKEIKEKIEEITEEKKEEKNLIIIPLKKKQNIKMKKEKKQDNSLNYDIFNVRRRERSSNKIIDKFKDNSNIQINPIKVSKEESSFKIERKNEGSMETVKQNSIRNFQAVDSKIKKKLKQAVQPHVYRLLDNKSREKKFNDIFERKRSSFAKKKKITVKDIDLNSKNNNLDSKRSSIINIPNEDKELEKSLEINKVIGQTSKKSSKQKIYKNPKKIREKRIRSLEPSTNSKNQENRHIGYKPSRLLVQRTEIAKRPVTSFSRRRREIDNQIDTRKLRSFLMRRQTMKSNYNEERHRNFNYAIHNRIKTAGIRDNKKRSIKAVCNSKRKEDEEKFDFYVPKERVKTAYVTRDKSFGFDSGTIDKKNNGEERKSFFTKIGFKPKNIKIRMRPSSAMPKRLTIRDL